MQCPGYYFFRSHILKYQVMNFNLTIYTSRKSSCIMLLLHGRLFALLHHLVYKSVVTVTLTSLFLIFWWFCCSVWCLLLASPSSGLGTSDWDITSWYYLFILERRCSDLCCRFASPKINKSECAFIIYHKKTLGLFKECAICKHTSKCRHCT